MQCNANIYDTAAVDRAMKTITNKPLIRYLMYRYRDVDEV